MGGVFSISLPWDQMVNQVSQWIWSEGTSIRNLPENLESLGDAIEILKAKREDVQRRVDRGEAQMHQRERAEVKVWLTNVLEIEEQFNSLHRTSNIELERLHLCGLCSTNFVKSYEFGKKVIMMLNKVETLSSQGEFDEVVETGLLAVEVMPLQPTIVGQETLLESAWNQLMKNEVRVVGLCGMGGVGKTTLLKQINNRFSEVASKFDIVISVVVSSATSVYKIQGGIGEKLGYKGEEWDNKNEKERAREIHYYLTKKRFVLLLDDIWEKVNLEAVGVPYPNEKNGSKVVFTTRSLEVCGRMGDHQPIKVNCLDPEQAWELFQKKVGVETLESDPDISELAREVAEKCHGLPLALNIIGETMSSITTVYEWRHTIKVLNSSATDFPDVKNGVLPTLKYSYDNLKDEQVQSCFLYCSVFPEDYGIEKENLIDYWICEGFIDEAEGREIALAKGYKILGTLVRACLLLDRDIETVSMHDVVRDMALWITTDFGKNKDKCIEQAGVGLHEIPKVKNWKDVRKMSLMKNDIEEINDSLECPQLTTLFLQQNKRLAKISREFFRSLTKLLVLDLSYNDNIIELPEEISNLVSLRYLDLSRTNIDRLPIGFQKLQMLIYLNLESTRKLESLDGISKLSSLRTFRLEGSKMKLDMSLIQELDLLEHLEYITIYISPSLFAEQCLYDSKVWKCITRVDIQDLRDESVRTLVWPAAMINLHEVEMYNCGITEIKIEKTSRNRALTTPYFSNLSKVVLGECDGLRDLTWLLFAPNLTDLYVLFLEQIETIINKEKAASVLNEEDRCNIVPFRKLKSLVVHSLPELKSIYWTSLPFPCLHKIDVLGCPNLRKLPLNSKSVAKIEEFTINFYRDEEWKNKIEWVDEDTKLRFLPSFGRK